MCSQTNLERVREVVRRKVSQKQLFSAFDVTLEVQELAEEAGETPELHRELRGAIHRELASYLEDGAYVRHLWDFRQDDGALYSALLYRPVGAAPTSYVAGIRSTGSTTLPGVFYKVETPVDTAAATLAHEGALVTESNLPSVFTQPAVRRSTLPSVFTQPAVRRSALPSVFKQPTVRRSALPEVFRRAVQSAALVITDRTPDGRGTVTVPNVLVKALGLKPADRVYVYKEPQTQTLTITNTRRENEDPVTTYTVDNSYNIRVTRHVLKEAGLALDATYSFVNEAEKILVSSQG